MQFFGYGTNAMLIAPTMCINHAVVTVTEEPVALGALGRCPFPASIREGINLRPKTLRGRKPPCGKGVAVPTPTHVMAPAPAMGIMTLLANDTLRTHRESSFLGAVQPEVISLAAAFYYT